MSGTYQCDICGNTIPPGKGPSPYPDPPAYNIASRGRHWTLCGEPCYEAFMESRPDLEAA